MSATFRTTTHTLTYDEASNIAVERANSFFGSTPYAYVSAHGVTELGYDRRIDGTESHDVRLVVTDWVFEELVP